MRSFSGWIIALFASPAGVVVLAALDSTLFFSLPFGIDAAVVFLAARLRNLAWLVPLLATGGSLGGAWLTFWMGIKIGEQGLDRYVSPKRIGKIRAKVRRSGAIALAGLDLIPPPFPFSPFVLAAGALHVKTSTFFITLATCRMLRFSLESVLAVIYGRRILGWLESDLFHDIVSVVILLAVALTIISTVRVIRSPRPAKRRTAA